MWIYLQLSSTRDLLVLFRSFYRGGKGFQGRARAIPSTGTFGEWSAWSECSANCGGCGVRRRTRICQPPNAVCLSVLSIAFCPAMNLFLTWVKSAISAQKLIKCWQGYQPKWPLKSGPKRGPIYQNIDE